MVKIKIIGSSHIAKGSVKKIRKEIKNNKPEIVAVELDETRVQALFNKNKTRVSLRDIRHLGMTGFLFSLIGKAIQEHLGKTVGMVPGSDMKAAILSTKKIKSKVFLIDKHILQITKEISRINFREKIRLVLYIFGALFVSPFLNVLKTKNKKGIDIRKVPPKKIIAEMITEFRKKFPSLYEILITKRNKHMCEALKYISINYPDSEILVVVGAGHIAGIKDILKNKYSIEIEEV